MIERFLLGFASGVEHASRKEFLVFLTLASAATLYLSYLAFRSLRWWRMIEDMPTSKARSAHQGYVELAGEAHLMDGPPIMTPMTQRECVWWSLHTERRTGDKWRTVNREASDELFYLRDETGDCIVDPEGALVTANHKRVSRGGTSPFLQIVSSKEYRHTEHYIAPHDHLYVIGFYRTFKSADNWNYDEEHLEKLREWKRDQDALLRRFDADKDGRISEAEWRTARRAARAEVMADHRDASVLPGVNVIGMPDDNRPFLIAAELESTYTRRLRRRGIAAGLGALVAFAVVAGMLGSRF